MAVEEFLNSMSMLLGEASLPKVLVFLVVQALVYFILTNSSTLFSSGSQMAKSLSFRTARSVSIRRMRAFLSDMPAGGELSPPSSSNSPSSSRVDHADGAG